MFELQFDVVVYQRVQIALISNNLPLSEYCPNEVACRL